MRPMVSGMICNYCNSFKVHSFYTPQYCSRACFQRAELQRKNEAQLEEKTFERQWKAAAAASFKEDTVTITATSHFGPIGWKITATVNRKQAAEFAWIGFKKTQQRQTASKNRKATRSDDRS
jgi:hypothetical protein